MIKKIKYRIMVLSKLLPFAYGAKRFFIFNLLLNVVVTGLTFITPLVYKVFIDDVLLGGRFDRMRSVIAGYLSIFFANTILEYIKNYFNNRLVNSTVFKVKLKIWRNFFRIPLREYETASIGDMKMRLEDDTAQIETFSEKQTVSYLISYITMIVSAIILFVIDWRLAIFSVVAIPLTFWLDNIISKREAVLNNQNRENDQKMTSWLHTSAQGWREIKALNLEQSQKRQFTRFLHKFALYFCKWINYWVTRVLIIPKIKDEFFMQFGLYFIGGLLIMNGNLKISDLLVFVMYYGMLSGAINTVSSSDAELQAAMPLTDRLLNSIVEPSSPKKTDSTILGDSNIICFENVSFAYPDGGEILHDISIQINKGDRVAVVGRSGSGKTTFLKLLTGMLSPTSGNIFFSGMNLSEIDISEMHKRIGYVMQETTLFNTSIRENLLYAKSGATDDELLAACEKAYIPDFVNSLPDKLDTVIGERGIKLSGGQKQRIVLARLFLRDVDIFIFDEATSALDQYSENIIHDAILNIGKDKTIIVSAHRESSINLCERKFRLS